MIVDRQVGLGGEKLGGLGGGGGYKGGGGVVGGCFGKGDEMREKLYGERRLIGYVRYCLREWGEDRSWTREGKTGGKG